LFHGTFINVLQHLHSGVDRNIKADAGVLIIIKQEMTGDVQIKVLLSVLTKLVETVSFLTSIQKMYGCNLGWGTDYPDRLSMVSIR
jgi:hypothetical protein